MRQAKSFQVTAKRHGISHGKSFSSIIKIDIDCPQVSTNKLTFHYFKQALRMGALGTGESSELVRIGRGSSILDAPRSPTIH